MKILAFFISIFLLTSCAVLERRVKYIAADIANCDKDNNWKEFNFRNMYVYNIETDTIQIYTPNGYFCLISSGPPLIPIVPNFLFFPPNPDKSDFSIVI